MHFSVFNNAFSPRCADCVLQKSDKKLRNLNYTKLEQIWAEEFQNFVKSARWLQWWCPRRLETVIDAEVCWVDILWLFIFQSFSFLISFLNFYFHPFVLSYWDELENMYLSFLQRNNMWIPSLSVLSYVAFDFHKECSHMRWERLQILVDAVAEAQDEYG